MLPNRLEIILSAWMTTLPCFVWFKMPTAQCFMVLVKVIVDVACGRPSRQSNGSRTMALSSSEFQDSEIRWAQTDREAKKGLRTQRLFVHLRIIVHRPHNPSGMLHNNPQMDKPSLGTEPFFRLAGNLGPKEFGGLWNPGIQKTIAPSSSSRCFVATDDHMPHPQLNFTDTMKDCAVGILTYTRSSIDGLTVG